MRLLQVPAKSLNCGGRSCVLRPLPVMDRLVGRFNGWHLRRRSPQLGAEDAGSWLHGFGLATPHPASHQKVEVHPSPNPATQNPCMVARDHGKCEAPPAERHPRICSWLSWTVTTRKARTSCPLACHCLVDETGTVRTHKHVSRTVASKIKAGMVDRATAMPAGITSQTSSNKRLAQLGARLACHLVASLRYFALLAA